MSDEGLIDLSPLDGSSSSPGLSYVDVMSGWTYYYNPCTPFTAEGCTNAAICQSGYSGAGYLIAVHSTTDFKVENDKVKITMNDGLSMRDVEITLTCDKNQEKNFLFSTESPLNHYLFTLTSKHACPHSNQPSGGGGGLSTGSVLCILLIVVILVYAIGGVLFNTFKRGATGKERIPNLSFWQDFPLLVKDGVKFAYTCGGTRGNYQEI